MILCTVLATAALLFLDARGGALWVVKLGRPFAMPAKTAQELVGALVMVHATFATLYFSITLLVLTLAAGNLGVRLIDRWISDLTIRFTLGLLMSLLAASIILLFFIDSDGPTKLVPRISLTVLTVATIAALGWMTNALHHLGRLVHIDTSIAKLGRDASRSLSHGRHLTPPGIDLNAGAPVLACETGYVDEIDQAGLLREACEKDAFVRLTHGTGDFMIAGEPIGTVLGAETGDWITSHVSCAQYRNDASGPEYESNLLVEIAARSLSPGINDFYTGLTCCDRLASILAEALKVHQLPLWLADVKGTPRLELPRTRVTEFMDGPLKALRQAAAPYPSVSIHMIGLIGRLPAPAGMEEDLRRFLLRHAEALAEHASARAETDRDREDIASALASTRRSLLPTAT